MVKSESFHFYTTILTAVKVVFYLSNYYLHEAFMNLVVAFCFMGLISPIGFIDLVGFIDLIGFTDLIVFIGVIGL